MKRSQKISGASIKDALDILFNGIPRDEEQYFVPYSVQISQWFQNQSVFQTFSLIFPIIRQIQNVDTDLLLSDLKASVTIALVSIPFSIAYSSLAQVPAVSGLISACIPALMYSLIGTSSELCFGPEAIISIMVGLGVRNEILSGNTMPPSMIASSLGMLCGYSFFFDSYRLLGVGLSLFQTGFIADVLSGYLLLGFVAGGMTYLNNSF